MPVVDSRDVRTARACVLRIIRRAKDENDFENIEKDIRNILDSLLQKEVFNGN
jgi:hypothetical protein